MSDASRTSAARLDRDRLTERLRSLVVAESENPPGNEKDAAAIAARQCEELGLDTELFEVDPGRPSVVARWTQREGPTLTFCSHIDVVPAGDPALWKTPPYSAEVRDGAMHGRGTSDAKGPCAAALEAVAIMKERGVTFDGTLELALVADEESGGFKGAAELVERGICRPEVAIVGEPTSLRVVRAQRGIAWSRITTRGRAGHGSAPERGINAVRHMAEVVLRLEDSLPEGTHPLLGGPTISVGTISGGEKVNIIPASCTIEVDRRTIPGETEASVAATFEAALDLARKRFPDLDATVEIVQSGLPFEVREDAPVVQEAAAAIEEVTGAVPDLIGFKGASDARFFSEAGADVIVCGPGDIHVAHTAREFIDLDELARAALAYAGAFTRLLGAR